MRIGIGWAEGPLKVADVVDSVFKSMIDNPDRDALDGFALSLRRSCSSSSAVTKFGKGFVANISVLLGIVVGAIVAALLGKMSFPARSARPPPSALVTPLRFGTAGPTSSSCRS